MEKLVSLNELMELYGKNDIQKIVALEKKMINFLNDEQLEEIAKCEKEILNELVNAKLSYDSLKDNYNKVADKLGSIGINVNDIIGSANNDNDNNEDYEDDEWEDDEDYDEDEDE